MNPAKIIQTIRSACEGYAEDCIGSADYADERSELDYAFSLISHELQGGRFQVEEQTIIDGWTNNWTDDEEKPLTFATIAEAQAEIDDLIQTNKDAVARGDMDSEYNPDEYRIVPA